MASVDPLPDLAELSDEALREQLEGYGVNVGPIVSTTRLFYEKKLGKMMAGGGSPPPSLEDTEESEGDYEEEDEEEVMEEEVQFNYKKPQMEVPQPVAPSITPSRPTAPHTQYTPITQQRRASPTRATTARHRPGVAPQTQTARSADTGVDTKSTGKGGRIAMWIKLLFIVIVAFLVYLVIINMNPTSQNKIPMSIDDV